MVMSSAHDIGPPGTIFIKELEKLLPLSFNPWSTNHPMRSASKTSKSKQISRGFCNNFDPAAQNLGFLFPFLVGAFLPYTQETMRSEGKTWSSFMIVRHVSSFFRGLSLFFCLLFPRHIFWGASLPAEPHDAQTSSHSCSAHPSVLLTFWKGHGQRRRQRILITPGRLIIRMSDSHGLLVLPATIRL